MADIKALEHPTLKVPYEVLNKRFRSTQKTLDREVSHVSLEVGEVEKAGVKKLLAKDIAVLLGNTVDKLQAFKRKLDESVTEELDAAQACKRRIEHLKAGIAPVSHPNPLMEDIHAENVENDPSVILWRKTRVERYIIEHLLRAGYYDTALKITSRNPELSDLSNVDVFLVARTVESSLAQKQTQTALAWCHGHRSKLRKLKSPLEFRIRQQEFIELVKADRRLEAVKHARKFLVATEDVSWDQVQQTMALLAFPVNTDVPAYAELLSEDRWTSIIDQFRTDHFRLYQLAAQSVLAVTLQAGLSALKTPQCYRGLMAPKNPDCPVCQEPLQSLAQGLPHAHCSQSRLVCYHSGQPLNEHNLPMILPNGYVYGEQTLRALAAEKGGLVTCPRTKEVFHIKEAEKVYVM